MKKWEGHNDEGICEVCNPMTKLGPSKELVKEGRPQINSVPSLLKHIKDMACIRIGTDNLIIKQIPPEFSLSTL